MRMRVISEVSHEIMKSMKLPSEACLSFYVRMLTESGTKWASVGSSSMKSWELARPRSPRILQGTRKRTGPSTMATNESRIILTI